MNTEEMVYFADDTQLMGYGESDSAGAWIKLQILPEQLEKFRGLKGTIFHSVFVRQNDQGEPVKPEEKPKGGPLSQLAATWCRDPQFWQWLNEQNAECGEPPGTFNEDDARRSILENCDIESRAELDHDGRARRLFEERFRRPYANYLARGQQ